MTESNLYHYLTKHLPRVHWVRLENITSAGIPDVEAAWNNRSVMVELKVQLRLNSNVYIGAAQRNFWVERDKVSDHLWLLVEQTWLHGLCLIKVEQILRHLEPSGIKGAPWTLSSAHVHTKQRLAFELTEVNRYQDLLHQLFTY